VVRRALQTAAIAETIIYGRRETGFVEWEKPNFEVGLNRTTPQSCLLGLGRWRIETLIIPPFDE
jgi:hypothetical protein